MDIGKIDSNLSATYAKRDDAVWYSPLNPPFTVHGVFYDEDGFVYTTFGKKSVTYAYKDIKAQSLYTSAANVIIELHMADGATVHISANLQHAYDFMDKAFAAWLVQTGRKQEDCPFYDPDNSCWFPPMEG